MWLPTEDICVWRPSAYNYTPPLHPSRQHRRRPDVASARTPRFVFAFYFCGGAYCLLIDMIVQPNPVTNQFQRLANDITARLAQLAKDPPDLLAYFRVHADCIVSTLKPVGFSYEMQNGQSFQRLLHSNLESLNYRGLPEQENSFERTTRMAATKRQSVLIPPNTLPSAGLHGLSVEDAPAPEELPIFNRTAFQQIFVPILLGQTAVGVLHIWFEAADNGLSQARVSLLQKICGEVELYLKARRLGDISQEVTRLTTYSRLLENLSGDSDLDSVAWNIVNFARETLSCDRVCLFIARNYERSPSATPTADNVLEHEFDLLACSGIKKPNPRSEQAVILGRVAQKLAHMSLSLPDAAARQGALLPEAAPAAATPAPSDDKTAPADTRLAEASPNGAKSASPDVKARPRAHLSVLARDPSKASTRPHEVNEYFDVMPMNWATVLPLFDRNGRVCGIVLFEGVKPAEKLAVAFSQMHDLGISAGRALGIALYWNRQPSLRLAQAWVNLRQRYVNTPTKRKLVRFGLPVALVVFVLVFPVTYKLKGDATILPVNQVSLPTLVGARLVNVQVREGEAVKKDRILAQLDTRDLVLQLRQVEQEYERSLLESQMAMSSRDELRMHVGRLNAAKAQAIADKIRHSITNSTLRAPMDGIVLGAQTLAARIGEVMRIGEPVLEVLDPSGWQVKVSMREQDLIYLSDHLSEHGLVAASLTLAANPARKYALELTSPSQVAYGLDTARGKYEFTVMLPLNANIADASLLKSGFAGRVTFKTDTRPLLYVFFKDFVNFLRVRFF